ncbi:MAG TPA: CPBP family intramembrane glutamic endopeptidase [Candidatus Nitrosotenuis sp.]|nr:CPBP family intramembrane glutamic endopeptidase [Candidatus Nitrosotenuis sp.]
METYKILQGIAIPYSALISVIFGIMVFSFPIGAYLFFNAQLGKDIDYGYPWQGLEFIHGLGGLEIADLFIAAWVFFLIIFTISVLGPKKNFLKILSAVMAGAYASQNGNYLVQTVKWFSILIFLSEITDTVQQEFGVKTTPPPFENDLLHFLGITISPIVEETAFRLILIGIPLFLWYSKKGSITLFFKSLWSPSNLPIKDSKKAVTLIVVVGVFFGLSHVISDQSWSNGKFVQAALSGIIIGWVYYKYGFVASTLIHWATNYLIYSYGYFVSSINEIPVSTAFSHSLLVTIEILFVITGAVSVSMLLIDYRQKKLEV